jgi:NADPH2:quinone reductase
VQIARATGLTVFGTASTDEGLELAKREGAQQVFNHGETGYQDQIMKATGGRGVDLILEMLANVNLGADLKMLANGGRVIVIGSRGEITINPRDLMSRRGSIRGFTLWALNETEIAEIHAGILTGLENRTLRPVVGKEIPLAEAARAHREVITSRASGKIVLIP